METIKGDWRKCKDGDYYQDDSGLWYCKRNNGSKNWEELGSNPTHHNGNMLVNGVWIKKPEPAAHYGDW